MAYVTVMYSINFTDQRVSTEMAAAIAITYDLTADQFYILDLLCNCVFSYCLSLLGVVGNIISLVVLRSSGSHNTTNIMLLSLSFSDLGYSLLMFLTRLKCVLAKFDVPLSKTFQAMTSVFLSSLASTLLGVSILTVTVVSIERLVAVSSPLHVSQIFSPKSTRKILIGIYVLSFAQMTPWFYRTTFIWAFDVAYNATVAMETYTQFYRDNYFIISTYGWGYLNTLMSIVTLIVISFSSLLIVVKLRSRFVKTTKSSEQELRVFKMLLTVCVVTAVVWVPTAVLDMYSFYGAAPPRVSALMTSIKHVLYQFGAGVNFIILVKTSSKFAAAFKSLFKCRR
ncbi:probable G-protein coupled receptor 139 [Physella acuta]|uniref:probable G-protein coupled receptor 139 n=1 Tax=Physella acuta TaxID=109671 RepID=UPI0027DE4CAD|nr:probable G-protein coupled receptor 139 [Physella acuta]